MRFADKRLHERADGCTNSPTRLHRREVHRRRKRDFVPPPEQEAGAAAEGSQSHCLTRPPSKPRASIHSQTSLSRNLTTRIFALKNALCRQTYCTITVN